MALTIDLQQFGLDWSISSDKSGIMPADYRDRISRVIDRNDKLVKFYDVKPFCTYKLGALLGEGKYGSVYECTREDGLKAVMKKVKEADLVNLIKESLVQIVIVELTKNIKHPHLTFKGPYAPVLYDFGYDEDTNTGYIVSQRMLETLDRGLQSRRADQDSAALYTSIFLVELGTILSDLNKIMKYNHRDLKPDNCMCIHEDNTIQVRLIDFGFSYLKYGDMVIETRKDDFKFTTLKTRDMSQFLYALYKYYDKYVPGSLVKPLADLLTFPLGGGVCKMWEGCDGLKEWKNSYDFLNSDTVVNPNADPDVVAKVFLKVANGMDYTSELAYAPGMMGLFVAKPAVPIKVAADKVYNPDTGRYVLAHGAVGRALLRQVAIAKKENRSGVAEGLGVKACRGEKPNYNPRTRRCVKKCPDGKKRNATFKCVVAVATAAAAVAKKQCTAAKPNYNPKTKRCVLACKPGKKRNSTFKCVKA